MERTILGTQHDVLLKRGGVLKRSKNVDTVVFDKTGHAHPKEIGLIDC
jgi:cation transport ATPase